MVFFFFFPGAGLPLVPSLLLVACHTFGAKRKPHPQARVAGRSTPGRTPQRPQVSSEVSATNGRGLVPETSLATSHPSTVSQSRV